MGDISPILTNISADFKRASEVTLRTPSPQRAVARDGWEQHLQPQGLQLASAHSPRPARPSKDGAAASSAPALALLRQFQNTLTPLSPNRRVASFMGNHEALQAMAISLPHGGDGDRLIEKLELPALVASISCNDLSTFEVLCHRHGSNLLAVASAYSAWLVRVAASRGGDFVQVLLHQLPVSKWHALLAEDDGSGFKSLLKHRQAELLTTMFAATRDAQVMALLTQSPRAVGEAMRSPKMVQILTPVLSRVNISLS